MKKSDVLKIVSEPTLGRWLRHPLEGERLERVKRGLEVLRKEVQE